MDATRKPRFSTTLDAWLSNLSKTGRSRKQAVSVAVDSTIVTLSLWAAFSLRHGLFFSDFRSTWYLFVVVPIFTVLIFMSLGIYRWVVRSSNTKLFRQLAKAVIVASTTLALFMFLVPPDRANPRSLFIIFGLLLMVGTAGVRFIWLVLFDLGNRGEPVAILGTGRSGQLLAKSFNESNEYRAVLFLEGESDDAGTTVAGIPVVSPESSKFNEILDGYEVEKVIIAIPELSAKEYQHKIEQLESTGLAVLTVPTSTELTSGKFKIEQIRDVSINDILGRQEVPPNPVLLSRCVHNKVVMVTGGGGSIGSELCRQIISQDPKKLIVLDHSEENLYHISEDLNQILNERDLPSDLFLASLNSVNDYAAVSRVITDQNVDTVYHAAAYKHVPIIEEQPDQGTLVNSFGTLNVVNAAIAAKVENFVLISTDKAVRPTNAMGATKRLAELILQAKAKTLHKTKISIVRFGNVLGSSGSVVPKFKAQINNGGPVTLTDANITRYFMTIPEAAQLVMQASSLARGGDVFVLDMGEPVRIIDLAKSMVRLSGKKLACETGNSNDIEIRIDGLRPGEKMFEELFLTDNHEKTEIPKVLSAREAWIPWDKLKVDLVELENLIEAHKVDKIREKLLQLAFVGIAEPSLPKKNNEAISASNLPLLNEQPASLAETS